jgi:hypothetical protein
MSPCCIWFSKRLLNIFSRDELQKKGFYIFLKKIKISHMLKSHFEWINSWILFMAINLITRNEFCLSKCEFEMKSCKNPLEMVALFKEPLLISFLFEALEDFRRAQSITKIHYIITIFAFVREKGIVLKQLEKYSRDFLVCEIK